MTIYPQPLSACSHWMGANTTTAELALARVKHLVQMAPEPHLLLDTAGCVLFVNEAWADLTGWPLGSLVGLPLADLLDKTDESALQSAIQGLANREGSVAIQLHVRTACGQQVVLRGQIVHCARSGIHLSAVDITALVAEFAKQSAAVEEERAAIQKERQLLALMAHEVKAPLAVLLASIESPREAGACGDHTDNRSHDEGKLATQALGLVQDVLEYVRARSTPSLATEWATDSRPMFDALRTTFSSIFEKNGFALDIRPPHPLTIGLPFDRLRVHLVLANLLGNALKHAGGGRVEVTVRAEPAKGLLRWRVADSGPGISGELARLLDSQSSLSTHAHRATHPARGMGLPIARQIAFELGGELVVTPGENGGAAFELVQRLQASPVLSKPTAPRRGCAPPVTSLGPRRALVVDDCGDFADLLAHFLGTQEVEAHVASSGGEAIELLNSSEYPKPVYDIVFVDMHLAHMDGCEVISTIREMGYQGPVVSLSGDDRVELRCRALAAGGDLFLAKPVSRSTLIHTIHHLFSPPVDQHGASNVHHD